MDIHFSIIIPAYNAEKTICRCLNSLLQSNRNDFEIIVVNDGSTDGTEDICQAYIAKDNRIKYYKKENGGVSSARNLGLKCAIGRYICFVDSDDFVVRDYFEQITDMLFEQCDLLIFGRKVYNGQVYKTDRYKSCLITDQNQIVSFLCSELRKQKLNFVCDKVFRRDLIDKYDITFPERLHIGEDKVFVIQYSTVIQNVKSADVLLYISSTENKNSLSRKIRNDLCKSAFVEHELMVDAICDSNLLTRHKNLFLSALSFSFYRSAYTVLGEMDRLPMTKSKKEELNRLICRKYKLQGKKYHLDIKSWCIALPVKLEMIKMIMFIMKCRNWKEKVE
ncbi:glycosyltransferase family 2 protein [Bariatricus sp. SGI.154]|uniref:glycosyltransferase family 2 protein n=1 Tax=Bariatricus sp. SGI.154 TaxID=3420549 RepID=UPI003CFCF876